MTTILGRDLRVGDTISVWWKPKQDTITRIEPYTGPLVSLLGEGTRIAYFAICTGGMTIPPDARHELVASMTQRAA